MLTQCASRRPGGWIFEGGALPLLRRLGQSDRHVIFGQYAACLETFVPLTSSPSSPSPHPSAGHSSAAHAHSRPRNLFLTDDTTARIAAGPKQVIPCTIYQLSAEPLSTELTTPTSFGEVESKECDARTLTPE